jgi:alkylation response protein AidB-like acyl-CoA dehydrogenase
MDLSFTDEQAMLKESIEKFIDSEYTFERRQLYAAGEPGFNPDVWKMFAELGWTAVLFSERDGGFDGGPVELMIMMQQFGRGLLVEPFLANVVLAGGVLQRSASAEQKARWLQPIIAGDLHAALAFSEPQSRYDLANIRTTAKKDGNEWIINGRKAVVLNAANADLIIVPARTSGRAGDTDGITLFAIDPSEDGLSRQSYPTVDGHRAAEIIVEEVRISNDAILGEVGTAYPALETVIDRATLAVSAEAVGIMQAMMEKTVEYSRSRQQFGVPIGSFQALQHRMVDMLTACEQSYSLLLWACLANADATDEARRSISALKYQVGTAGKKVGQEAVQLHGGMGVSWELDIAHYFKRLTAISLLFGDADWHLDKLAAAR